MCNIMHEGAHTNFHTHVHVHAHMHLRVHTHTQTDRHFYLYPMTATSVSLCSLHFSTQDEAKEGEEGAPCEYCKKSIKLSEIYRHEVRRWDMEVIDT